MDKIPRKKSFEQWFSPISTEKMQEYVESHQLNYYTKKLYMVSFLKILLYAQLESMIFKGIDIFRCCSNSVFIWICDTKSRKICWKNSIGTWFNRRPNCELLIESKSVSCWSSSENIASRTARILSVSFYLSWQGGAQNILLERVGTAPHKYFHTYLEIRRFLKVAWWKSAHIWLRKIKGKAYHKEFLISVVFVKDYSKKMDIHTSAYVSLVFF